MAKSTLLDDINNIVCSFIGSLCSTELQNSCRSKRWIISQ